MPDSGPVNLTVTTLDGVGHSLIHHPELFPAILEWLASHTE
jgi:hypothetical protein